jgi:hypothetical protein
VVHFHGYMWTGAGSEVLVSDGRRSHGHPEFGSFGQLPYHVTDTLLKSPSHVRGTWDDPEQAVAWMRSEREKLGPVMYPEQNTMAPTLDEKCEYHLERLHISKSVVWGIWLNGGRYADIRVICCSPAESGKQIRCPTGR